VDDAVEVRELRKVYKTGQKPAVDGLSFTVRRGEVFGLLGPNGAGKTTTVGVLTTRACPEVGRTRVVRTPTVVVLPAPFGPSSPKTSPRRTVKLNPSTAGFCPVL